MKVIATHYICLKGNDDKDVLVMKSGETRDVTKAIHDRLAKEAAGKFHVAKEDIDGK